MIWRLNTGEYTEIQGSEDVCSIASSPIGASFVSGHKDSTIKIWDAATLTKTRTLRGRGKPVGCVGCVTLSLDRRIVASAGEYTTTVVIWSIDTGQCVKSLRGGMRGTSSVAFSPDGKLVAAGASGKITIWNVDTACRMRTVNGLRLDGPPAFLDGGRLIAAVNSRAVQIWSIETGRSLQTLDGHQDFIVGLASSCNGALIAAGSNDWKVRIWSADLSNTTVSSRIHHPLKSNIALSEDQTLLASIMASEDGQSTWVWRVDTGDCVQRMSRLVAPNLLALSPTRALAAEVSGPETEIRILDADTLDFVQAIPIKSTWNDATIKSIVFHRDYLLDEHFSFSPEGELLIHKSWRIYKHSTPTGSGIFPFPPGTHVFPAFHLLQTVSAFHISQDREWVMWKGHRLLWLPPELRLSSPDDHDGRVMLSHSVVVIVTPAGRLVLMGFLPDALPEILRNPKLGWS